MAWQVANDASPLTESTSFIQQNILLFLTKFHPAPSGGSGTASLSPRHNFHCWKQFPKKAGWIRSQRVSDGLWQDEQKP